MIFYRKRGKYRGNCCFSLIKSLFAYHQHPLESLLPSFWEPQETNRLTTWNDPAKIARIWPSSCERVLFLKAILSAFWSFSLQSLSQRNSSGQTQISVLQSPPCGLGHCFSQLLVYYFDAIVYASKWKDGKKSSCWVVLLGKEGLSSLSSRPSPSLPQVPDVSLFSVLLHNPLLGLTKLQGAVELSFHYLKGTNSVGQLPTLPISQSQP